MIDIAIVGGGLSGMVIAHELHHKHPNKTWELYEANSFIGGRLVNDQDSHDIDLGGAWIWPSHQPLMRDLLRSLDIESFPQPDDPSCERIICGAARIITAICDDLRGKNIFIHSPIISCKRSYNRIKSDECNEESKASTDNDLQSLSFVTLETSSGIKVQCKRVVFTIPPKILLRKIQFDPPLNLKKQNAILKSQTWMAGVTKVSLVFESRFWSVDNNGGDSNMALKPMYNSPAFQVYDGSPFNNECSVLTFFTLASLYQIPKHNDTTRNSHNEKNVKNDVNEDALLARQCARQLGRTWSSMGKPMALEKAILDYKSYYLKRWPLEPFISDNSDPKTIHPHPYPMKDLASNDWDDLLLFAGTETDLSSPGVMEGAVGSSHRVLAELEKLWNI
mmetsp:Transcript_6704/g.8478  ORF Transcript_6704/g.8478 Transcript_6704/m.8478 type:complete len:392 (-) Transcript_6704:99-1274(-)